MSESTPLESNLKSSDASCATRWLLGATVVAAVGTFGSVLLSMGLGLKACPLCFYQRSFVMAALAVLVLGGSLERSRAGLICLLSVPLAFAGLGVAVFHEYLVLAGTLECPQALFGIGSAPAQSLATFIALAATTCLGAWHGRRESRRQGPSTLVSTALLGCLMAGACILSAPPLPQVPTAPYDPVKNPLDTCRRPFRAPSN